MKNFSPDDIVISLAGRSILGAVNGSLKDLTPAGLGEHVGGSIISKAEEVSPIFSRDMIKKFILGFSISAGSGQNLPRQIGYGCQLKHLKSAFAVNEMCGSSMEALIIGMQSLRLEEDKVVFVGGIEMPSFAPYLISPDQFVKWQNKTLEEISGEIVRADMYDGLWCRIYDVHTIVHAENFTEQWVKNQKLDREAFKEEIDNFALLSHEKALKAIASGAFKEEIVPVPGCSLKDELPKKKNIKRLGRARGTHFTPDGIFLTNHNSPPLVNCGAFLMLMKLKEAERLKLPILARITGVGRGCTEPEDYLFAPILAMRDLSVKTGIAAEDFDLLELNPAFGSQMGFYSREYPGSKEKINIHGDCIALGHPIGAAGIRIITTLLYSLKRYHKKRGAAAICLGGGNGIAVSVERMD